MKRLILTATLAVGGLTLPVVAEGATPQPIYFWGSVVAVIKAPGQPPAVPELIRPPLILLAEDGSSVIEHLRWTGWGSSVAHATGISSASNGIPNMAQGKRINKPAKITLSSPGLFQGREVYRCFTLTVAAAAAGEPLCLTDHGGYWGLAAAATSTPGSNATATTTPATATTTGASFYSPSRNLSCEIDDGGSGAPAQVYCQSWNPPSSVHLGLDGKLVICSGTGAARRCLGNPGENTPTLAYGKQVSVGRFRCGSDQTGVTCTLLRSGKGFLISSAGVRPVGGATSTSP